MRILSRSDIEQSISMPEVVAAVREGYASLSSGEARVPARIALPAGEGVTLFMPGAVPAAGAMAIKIVSVHPGNPGRGLPLIHALVLAIEPETGRPLAAIEGGLLTALRTGAGSGVATDLLARREAEVGAIFGAGVQARTQLLAVAAVRRMKQFRIYARRRETVEAMIAELRPRLDPAIELRAADSPADAVRGADVVCAATTSATPVFDGRDLKPGAHVNAVGSFQPSVQEIDTATLARASRIVVDSIEGAMTEAGDLLIAIERGVIGREDLYGEIGEIAAGRKPGRETDDEITFFKSVGNAVQDVVVANAIYRRALALGLGLEVAL